ncbi:MAG: c-type cytochrome [Mangrovicoccus sp.]
MKRLVIIGILTAGTAFAHSGVKNADVLARMEGMKQIGSAMKTLGMMVKGQTGFDASLANEALNAITAEAQKIPELFETPATDPKSEALPVIWDEFEDFTAKARDLEKLAGKLAGSIESKSELETAMQQIGQSCKSCHSDYRQ